MNAIIALLIEFYIYSETKLIYIHIYLHIFYTHIICQFKADWERSQSCILCKGVELKLLSAPNSGYVINQCVFISRKHLLYI